MSAVLSVVIPCFDHGRYLRDAVDSVLAGGSSAVQVVVVNDGSTDDSLKVARSYGDAVTVVDQRNAGLSAARNAGLAVATGTWVQFLDADDRVAPEFVGHMLSAIVAHPDAAVLCGGWRICDDAWRPVEQGAVDLGDDAYARLLAGNPMPCHAAVVRRDALGDGAPFDTGLAALEDWDLWLRLARAGHAFVPVPEARVDYRRHEGSMSRDVGRMLAAAERVLARHRGRHRFAAWQARRRIRYGLYCDNVLPVARRDGWGAFVGALLRQPRLIESVPVHVAFALCPWLRRRLGASARPFRRDQIGDGDSSGRAAL